MMMNQFSIVIIKNLDDIQKKAEDIVEDPSKELWSPLVDNILIPLSQITLIILLTYLALRYVVRLVDRVLNLSRFHEKKGETLARLIKSTARYAIYFVAAITILDKLGIKVTPILAGAGVVGLAVGFGAQNLVKDVITGFFIIFDNQMEVGDFVQINGGIEGTVEEIGLRVTKVREFNQRLHYISNGEINRVTNYNRDRMRPLIAVTVPYEEDQDKVQRTLQEVCKEVSHRFSSYMIEPFSIYGVTNIQRDGVEYTVTALSTPEELWMIEREMRISIVKAFTEKNIEIAYPRQVFAAAQQPQHPLSPEPPEEKQ
ncbi:mechanosensitive ion channel family protein [Kroppenstedtia pulmonis]|uniref:Mechanosensitive ion channel family protein n=1 Tax=Kroppenstedtia pulmonis TaxID=1380685 RepID=A0A7D3Y899_9BACL|nr:mechanosensitive ion channel family protein [Kroppenstedtia pulmonis]QKG83421.1 mechanosensitive ion channel family protein [Kroppenstedtia pulmonis]